MPQTLARAVKTDCQAYTQLCDAFNIGPQAWSGALAKQQMTSMLQAVHLLSHTCMLVSYRWAPSA